MGVTKANALVCGACTCCEDWKSGTCAAKCDAQSVVHGYSNSCPGTGKPGICDFCGCDDAGGGGGVPNRSICKDNKCQDVYDPLNRPGNCSYDYECVGDGTPGLKCSFSLPGSVAPQKRVNWTLNIYNGPATVSPLPPKTSGSCTQAVGDCSGSRSSCGGYFTMGKAGNQTCTITATVTTADGQTASCTGSVRSLDVTKTPTLTPTPTLKITTTVTTTVTVSPTVTPTNLTPTVSVTPTVSGTITPSPTPGGGESSNWFKTELGDVHSNSDIIDPIPEDDFFASFLVTTNGLSTFGPLGTFNAAPERASKANWFWYSPPYGKVTFSELTGFYNYYSNLKPADSTQNSLTSLNNAFFNTHASSVGSINKIKISPPGGSLSTSEDIVVSGNNKLIIYIEGDFNIRHNIFIKDNAGVIFVVSKNLSIGSDVFEADGMYLVDESISTKDHDTNTPLVIKGALFVSQGGKIFSSSRTLEEQTIPAEWITYEPKYLINFASVLGRTSLIWKEVAP